MEGGGSLGGAKGGGGKHIPWTPGATIIGGMDPMVAASLFPLFGSRDFFLRLLEGDLDRLDLDDRLSVRTRCGTREGELLQARLAAFALRAG